ncbi:hypothetical protein TNCV_4690471 [Trichonephila clavipes]|nr:hypothetical protein TNCV_4690471 [Trichonephila clavipes]
MVMISYWSGQTAGSNTDVTEDPQVLNCRDSNSSRWCSGEVMRSSNGKSFEPRSIQRASIPSALWVFSGTRLEHMTRRPRVHNLGHYATVTTR